AYKVVVMDVPEEKNEDEALSCARARAAGFVRHEAPLTEVVDAVRGAVRGETYFPRRFAALVFRALAHQTRRAGASLTRREKEIKRLLDHNLSNREIAERLELKLATVRNYVHSIRQKVRVRPRRRRTGGTRR